jgi:hypothetical protein
LEKERVEAIKSKFLKMRYTYKKEANISRASYKWILHSGIFAAGQQVLALFIFTWN